MAGCPWADSLTPLNLFPHLSNADNSGYLTHCTELQRSKGGYHFKGQSRATARPAVIIVCPRGQSLPVDLSGAQAMKHASSASLTFQPGGNAW